MWEIWHDTLFYENQKSYSQNKKNSKSKASKVWKLATCHIVLAYSCPGWWIIRNVQSKHGILGGFQMGSGKEVPISAQEAIIKAIRSGMKMSVLSQQYNLAKSRFSKIFKRFEAEDLR